jgi:RNA polymerase sigma factor (TIGR02999 family)
MHPDPAELTELLRKWRHGDQEAADRILAATYDQLRRVARGFLRRERQEHTLQPTALVHEAYLRLFRDEPIDLASRDEFFRLVAAQMRRQLIDHARRRGAERRGGHLFRADFDEAARDLAAPAGGSDEEVFAKLEQALAGLEKDHPRPSQVVRLRFFGGLSNEEVAKALGMSAGTVKRDFAFAKAWLARALQE